MTHKRSLTPSSLGLAQGKTPMNEEEILRKQVAAYDETGSVLFTKKQLATLPREIQETIDQAYHRAVASLFGQRKQK